MEWENHTEPLIFYTFWFFRTYFTFRFHFTITFSSLFGLSRTYQEFTLNYYIPIPVNKFNSV